jgi:hypothetical protein
LWPLPELRRLLLRGGLTVVSETNRVMVPPQTWTAIPEAGVEVYHAVSLPEEALVQDGIAYLRGVWSVRARPVTDEDIERAAQTVPAVFLERAGYEVCTSCNGACGDPVTLGVCADCMGDGIVPLVEEPNDDGETDWSWSDPDHTAERAAHADNWENPAPTPRPWSPPAEAE